MNTDNELLMLKQTLVLTYDRVGQFTHPSVLSISQQLDQVIMEHYKKMGRHRPR